MDKKIFHVYLEKEGVPNNESYAKLNLPASPWELWDALDKVRLQTDDILYMEIEGYDAFEYLSPHLDGLDISLNELNASANRGACMQVCRRSYIVKDKESDIELEVDNKYIMSPKDLKTIRFMDEMIEAGVRVFKIEGRARGPEYVKTVVECYKEAIQSYLDGTFTEEKKNVWDERLKTVFNRGFWNGYYLGQRLGEWSKNYGSEATEKKVYAGRGIKYFSNIGVAEFLIEATEIKVGDKLLITGPTTGAMYVDLEEARVDLKPVDVVKKGQHVSFKVPERMRPSDKLYRIVPAEELKAK